MYPHVDKEPPLACYTLAAGCQGTAGKSAVGGVARACKKAKKKRHGHKRKRCKKRKRPKRHL
jgi:hypothetical protein